MNEGDYRPAAYGDEGRHYASIPLYLILTLLTAFLFNLYWNYRPPALAMITYIAGR